MNAKRYVDIAAIERVKIQAQVLIPLVKTLRQNLAKSERTPSFEGRLAISIESSVKIQVAANFEAKAYEAGSCSWVFELKLHDKEAEGYTYYPHPSGGAKCYRVVPFGKRKSQQRISNGETRCQAKGT